MKCGADRKTSDKKTGEETMTGPFKWDLVNASKGHGFSTSISRTLKTHEVITAHNIWLKLDIPEKAAFSANCGQGVGATWTETAPLCKGCRMMSGELLPDGGLRLKTEESKLCECGLLKDHTLAC